MGKALLLVLAALYACDGCNEPEPRSLDEIHAEQAAERESSIETAIEAGDIEELTGYEILSPEGAHIDEVRAALRELARAKIPEYRRSAARHGGDPALVLAVADLLESALDDERRNVSIRDQRELPETPRMPQAFSPEAALRSHLEYGNPYRYFDDERTAGGLERATDELFAFSHSHGPLADGEPGIALTRTLQRSRSVLQFERLGSFPSLDAVVVVRVNVPAQGDRPARSVERSDYQTPEELRVEYTEIQDSLASGRNTENADWAVYQQIFRHLSYFLKGRASGLLGAPRSETRAWSGMPEAFRALDAVVESAEGLPVSEGARCRLQGGQGDEPGRCRFHLICEGHILYGARRSGYGPCPSDEEPRFVDPDITAVDGGDPAVTFDFEARTVELLDSAEGEPPVRMRARLVPIGQDEVVAAEP